MFKPDGDGTADASSSPPGRESLTLSPSSPPFLWKDVLTDSTTSPQSFPPPTYLDDGTPVVLAPPDVLLRASETWKGFILCSFFGTPPPAKKIFSDLNPIWGKKGAITVKSFSEGTCLILVPSLSTRNWVLQVGFWSAGTVAFAVTEWSPSASLTTAKLTSAPLWLTLQNVPPQLWSIEGVRRIASGVGKPIPTSRPLLSMDQLGTAKVRAIINLKSPLPAEILVKDTEGNKARIPIDYGKLPPLCSVCSCFGHRPHRCPLQKQNSSSPETNPSLDPTVAAHQPAANQSVQAPSSTSLLASYAPVSPSRLSQSSVQNGGVDIESVRESIPNPSPSDNVIGPQDILQPIKPLTLSGLDSNNHSSTCFGPNTLKPIDSLTHIPSSLHLSPDDSAVESSQVPVVDDSLVHTVIDQIPSVTAEQTLSVASTSNFPVSISPPPVLPSSPSSPPSSSHVPSETIADLASARPATVNKHIRFSSPLPTHESPHPIKAPPSPPLAKFEDDEATVKGKSKEEDEKEEISQKSEDSQNQVHEDHQAKEVENSIQINFKPKVSFPSFYDEVINSIPKTELQINNLPKETPQKKKKDDNSKMIFKKAKTTFSFDDDGEAIAKILNSKDWQNRYRSVSSDEKNKTFDKT